MTSSRDGIIRNAVNFPSLPAEEFVRLQPYVTLAERLGSLVSQMGDAHITSVGVRYYGGLANGRNDLIAGAVLVGLFKRYLVERRDAGQRQGRGRRARHRARRIAQLARAELHVAAVGAGAHRRGSALGGRDRGRARRRAARARGRRARRCAARRHADPDQEQRSAGRHRRGRAPCSDGTASTSRTSLSAAAPKCAIGVVGVDEGGGAVLTGEVIAELRTDSGRAISGGGAPVI